MLLTNDNLQTGINQTGSHSQRTEDHQGRVMKTKVDTDKPSPQFLYNTIFQLPARLIAAVLLIDGQPFVAVSVNIFAY